MPRTLAPAATSRLLPSGTSAAVLPEQELLELFALIGHALQGQADALEDQGGCQEAVAWLRNIEARLEGPATQTVRMLFRQIRVAV